MTETAVFNSKDATLSPKPMVRVQMTDFRPLRELPPQPIAVGQRIAYSSVGHMTDLNGEPVNVIQILIDCGVDANGDNVVQPVFIKASELGSLQAELMQGQVDDVVMSRST